MAEVGGKFRQVSFDIDPAAIPPEQGVDGQPVAKLVSEKPPVRQRPGPGLCKGMITIVADDEEHLKDFEAYMP